MGFDSLSGLALTAFLSHSILVSSSAGAELTKIEVSPVLDRLICVCGFAQNLEQGLGIETCVCPQHA